MIVAGIDGSTKNTGIAIIQDNELIFYTLISHNEKDAYERIRLMLIDICNVLSKYDLDAICIERAIKKVNIDTTIKLAMLSGGVLLYCAQNNIKFVNPLPSEWRATVGLQQSKNIKRETLKAEAIKAVHDEYGIDVSDDVAEAILISRSAFDLPKINITEDDLWG